MTPVPWDKRIKGRFYPEAFPEGFVPTRCLKDLVPIAFPKDPVPRPIPHNYNLHRNTIALCKQEPLPKCFSSVFGGFEACHVTTAKMLPRLSGMFLYRGV